MTVAELIETLRSLPSDARVVVPGPEGGFMDTLPARLVQLALDVNADMHPTAWGPHEVPTVEFPHVDHEIVPAVLIEGDSNWSEPPSRGSCPVPME
jgi:hypothetical protein